MMKSWTMPDNPASSLPRSKLPFVVLDVKDDEWAAKGWIKALWLLHRSVIDSNDA